MEGFSKAVAQGKMTRREWQWIKTAHMDTQEFKKQAIEAAVELGTLKKVGKDTWRTLEGNNPEKNYVTLSNFESAMKDGWMTTDVMNKVLAKFGDTTEQMYERYTNGDWDTVTEMLADVGEEFEGLGLKAFKASQEARTFTDAIEATKDAVSSQWAKSFKYIFGNKEEAVSLWTDLANELWDVFAASGEARNEMLALWHDAGGRDDLIQGLWNTWNAGLDVLNTIKEAFREVFPPMTSEKLLELTKRFKEFTEQMKPSEETLEKINRIFRGLFSVLKVIIEGFKTFGKILGLIWEKLNPFREALFDAAVALADWVSGVAETLETSGAFEKVIEGIANVFSLFGEVMRLVADKILVFFGVFSKKNIKELKENSEGVEEATKPIMTLGEVFTNAGELIKKAWNSIKTVLSIAWEYIKAFGAKIKEALEYFFGGELHFDTLMHAIRELINLGILNSFRKIVDGLGNATQGLGGTLKNAAKTIKDVGKEITGVFSDIRDVISAYKKEKLAEVLKTVATALLMLAAALFILSKIDSDKLWESMGGMTVMLTELLGSMAIISKMLNGKELKSFGKISVVLIAFSAAILILASALKKICSVVETGKLGASIVGITVLIGELVVAARLLTTDGSKQVIKAAGIMIGIAIAVDLLTIAVKQLSGIDWPDLGKGLLGIFGILMMLVASVNMMDKKMGIGTGIGLVLLATSLIIVGKALENIGSLDIFTLAKGMFFMAGGLMAIVVALNAIPNGVLLKSASVVLVSASLLLIGKALENIGSLDLPTLAKGFVFMAGGLMAIVVALTAISSPASLAGGAAILIVSGSLLVLASALKKVSSLKWDELAIGMIGLVGGLMAIVVALVALSNPMVLAGAAALLVASASLIVLAEALKIAGSLGWESMLQGLLALIGLLALVAGASVLLTPLIPSILGVGAALAVFGAGILVCTIPLAILVDLMKSLIEFGGKGIAALTDFLLGLIGMIPEIIKQIGLGVIAFAEAISTGGPAIIGALTTIIVSLCNAVIESAPKIFEAIGVLLEGILNLIIRFAPKIVEAGWTILMSFLKGIRDNIQELVEVGTDIIVNFIKGIEYAIPRIVDEAFNLIIVFIDTLGTTIRDKTPILVDHVWDMAENIVIGLWEGLKHFFEKGKEKIGNFGNYIIETIEDVFGIPHGSIKAGASKFFDMAGQIVTGIINGFKEGLNSIGEAVSEVGENIVNGFKNFFHIQSPSKLMRDEVGNYIVDGISEGIKKNTSAEEAARIKAQNIAKAFKTEIDKIDLSRQTSDLMNNLWSTNQSTKENRINRLLEEEYAKEKPNERYIQELEAKLAKSDEERTLMQIEQTKGYLQDLQEKEKLAKGEYDVSVNTFGKDSDEAKKAWNAFLQAQINTIDKQNELEDLEYTYARDKRDQAEQQRKQNEAIENSYYEWIIKNTKALKQFGYTTEEIQKAASDATGFDPTASQNKMEDATKEATLNSMEAVNETYQANAEKTFGSLNPEFESYGQQYGTNLANGLKEEKGLVISESTALSQGSLAALNDHTNEYYEAGKEAGKAYSDGLKEYANQALNTSNGLYNKSNSALREAYSKKSSEMKTTYSDAIKQIAQKEGVDMGVAFDMLKANARGGSYASGVSYDKDALSKDYKELEDISKAIAGDTVASVLKSGGDASAIVSTVGIKSSTSSSSARSTSSSVKSSSGSSSSSSSSNSGTTINYTQNISSPKATTNSEIYRSSKTALSAIGSIVSSVSPIGGAVTKIASSILSGKNPLAN